MKYDRFFPLHSFNPTDLQISPPVASEDFFTSAKARPNLLLYGSHPHNQE